MTQDKIQHAPCMSYSSSNMILITSHQYKLSYAILFSSPASNLTTQWGTFFVCDTGSSETSMFLPPANEVRGKIIFPVACVKNSVHGGDVPGQVHPPGRYTPGQVHLRAGTPLRQVHPRQVHPLGRYTPPGAVHAGKYGNKRAVRILLECILLRNCIQKFVMW